MKADCGTLRVKQSIKSQHFNEAEMIMLCGNLDCFLPTLQDRVWMNNPFLRCWFRQNLKCQNVSHVARRSQRNDVFVFREQWVVATENSVTLQSPGCPWSWTMFVYWSTNLKARCRVSIESLWDNEVVSLTRCNPVTFWLSLQPRHWIRSNDSFGRDVHIIRSYRPDSRQKLGWSCSSGNEMSLQAVSFLEMQN